MPLSALYWALYESIVLCRTMRGEYWDANRALLRPRNVYPITLLHPHVTPKPVQRSIYGGGSTRHTRLHCGTTEALLRWLAGGRRRPPRSMVPTTPMPSRQQLVSAALRSGQLKELV
eukprot:COSAG01_NODE_1345_length_10632_cov_648.255863_1_plen_116_part_10